MAGRVMRCNGVPNSDGVTVDFEAVGADAFGRECFGACGDVCGFHVVIPRVGCAAPVELVTNFQQYQNIHGEARLAPSQFDGCGRNAQIAQSRLCCDALHQ